MKSNTKQFPKNKIAWLWENMEGKRALYFVGILGTVLYNILQLTIPYFSGKIVDLFLPLAVCEGRLYVPACYRCLWQLYDL